jgi:hypothetical protein
VGERVPCEAWATLGRGDVGMACRADPTDQGVDGGREEAVRRRSRSVWAEGKAMHATMSMIFGLRSAVLSREAAGRDLGFE